MVHMTSPLITAKVPTWRSRFPGPERRRRVDVGTGARRATEEAHQLGRVTALR